MPLHVSFVFRQLSLTQAPFKYPAGLGPGLSIGCLLSIVGPEESVKQLPESR
jgi:hypothetical protein